MVGKLKMANSYIPFEMQEEIMKRLPVKSLLRFRSVSKHWKSLIHSSKFIVDYRVQKHRLLVRYADTENGYYTELKYVSIADDDTFPRQKHDLTFPMSLKSSVRKSMGNSHGLLCFSYGKVVVIWNPTIQKTVSIDVHDALDLPYETFYGFGVCLDTCDPKLVKMIFDSNLKESYTVEIFTLSSGVWRLPHSNLPRKSICFTHCRVYVDGRIYWCAYDYVRLPDGLFQRSKMIMSFATTSEEFTEISFPNSLALKAGIGLGITKLRDSLIVVEIILNDQVYGIWMMKNHGDPKSFTKLFNINFNINLADASMIPVIGFRNSGEAIVRMKNDDSDALYVYEPNTKHISFFGISHPYSLSSYTETLLLLDH